MAYFVVTVSLLVLGEVAAFNGLYEGETDARTNFVIVSMGVAASLLGISVTSAVVLGETHAEREIWQWLPERAPGWLPLVVCLAIAALVIGVGLSVLE